MAHCRIAGFDPLTYPDSMGFAKICFARFIETRSARLLGSYVPGASHFISLIHLFRPSLIFLSLKIGQFPVCILVPAYCGNRIEIKLYRVSTKSIPSTGTTKPETKIHRCFERANQLLSLL
jgi:hypothetical protein